MAYLADTHVHSIYSYDGQMRLETGIKRGIELGLKYIAFTEHVEFDQISLKQFLNRFACYSEEIDILQDKYPNIKLIKGLEISNPERHLEEFEIINTLDLDYILGSNHILPRENTKEGILTYYKRILEIVKNGGIDALAHLDYIKRRYSDSFVPDEIFQEIFRYLIDYKIALEINTSALRRKGIGSFPSSDKLELYKKLGGTLVTIGSDAHRIEEIYDNIEPTDHNYEFNKGLYLKRKFVSLCDNQVDKNDN